MYDSIAFEPVLVPVMEELSVSGWGDGAPSYGNGLRDVNLQGLKLKSIDLSKDGLYDVNWTIGSFTYVPAFSGNNFDNYTGTSDRDRTKGHQLNMNTYESVSICNFELNSCQTTETDDDGEEHTVTRYYIDYDIIARPKSESSNSVDWTKWGCALSEPDSRLVMHSNAINFQWVTGSSVSIGEAYDNGQLLNRPTISPPGESTRPANSVEHVSISGESTTIRWRELPLITNNEGGHTGDRYSVRFGTLDDEMLKSDIEDPQITPMLA